MKTDVLCHPEKATLDFLTISRVKPVTQASCSPVIKKEKKKRHDVHFLYSANQSEKHTQVHFLLADDRFHPHAVDNNEKSKTVCTHTLLLPVTPNTDISGTSQRDVHIHFANTQSQWKTDVLCLNTVKQSRGRAKSQIHLQQIVDVFTHT